MKLPHRANPCFPIQYARENAAFTLLELLITIAIVIVLAALAFTGGSKMIDRAHETDALQDLKSIHAATVLYTTDNNGDLFFIHDNSGSNGGWQNLWVDKLVDSLPHQGKVPGSFRNAAFYNSKIKASDRWVADYAANDNIIFSSDAYAIPLRRPLKLSRIESPAQEVMFVEGSNNYPPDRLPSNTGGFVVWAQQAVNGNFGYPNTIAKRHGGETNPAFYVVYCDGHAERIMFKKFSSDKKLRQTMFSANQNGGSIYR